MFPGFGYPVSGLNIAVWSALLPYYRWYWHKQIEDKWRYIMKRVERSRPDLRSWRRDQSRGAPCRPFEGEPHQPNGWFRWGVPGCSRSLSDPLKGCRKSASAGQRKTRGLPFRLRSGLASWMREQALGMTFGQGSCP